MNTSGSEHLASQVTTHEQMVEIVQYSGSSDLSLSLSLSLCLSLIHSEIHTLGSTSEGATHTLKPRT